jgi:hypothetical protein
VKRRKNGTAAQRRLQLLWMSMDLKRKGQSKGGQVQSATLPDTEENSALPTKPLAMSYLLLKSFGSYACC